MTDECKNTARKRLRDLGIHIGRYRPGKLNAITDVAGVLVGHSTVSSPNGAPSRKIARTGVTAIVPNHGNYFMERIVGGSFVLNGAGEVSGLTQLQEWGIIETPILLTNTHSVGTVSEGVVKYMVGRHPEIGVKHDVVIPLVGECDDSWLSDASGHHVKTEHVFEAIEQAKGGPVEEGSVGGGTGMITCDFKGGIGTSSRKLHQRDGGYTLGVLVLSNFGEMRDLRMNGIPIGEILRPRYANYSKRRYNYGSIIAVLATDAPLTTHQLNRLAKRVAVGIGRVGSYAAHGSGEIVLAFSTANKVPRETNKIIYRMKILMDSRINPLYEAAIEATEEAILNALCLAQDMKGFENRFVPALPLEEVVRIFRDFERCQPVHAPAQEFTKNALKGM